MKNHKARPQLPDDPLWYKDAIIYQLHVRSFYDSDGNGIGDFKGLTEKLPYLEQLGITAVWLLPFYPSPLKDDGYDISDYSTVNTAYGTLNDFHNFLREAHGRGIRVITELVINHTSDQHPWFQRARSAPAGSKERNFYVWSNTTEKYEETRIIFKDFETSNWTRDPVANSYYWHRFYSHQPDLNFNSPTVKKEVFQILDMWFKRGVDGMRLDAVPYLCEKEGTSCENLPESHAVLKELRKHIDSKFKNKMLLAEANMWPEDAVAYFGDGNECQMAFHFPVMPRMFMAVNMEDRYPIIEIMEQTPDIPENCQWATFLRNHDELTLEMVTDRERDYMYQVYAQDKEARINLGIRRRLAPLMGNNRRSIELLNSLYFSLPGTPIIYYGDEIGMGDNFYLGDRNGVRTPMQWSPDRNAGFSRANSQSLYLPPVIDSEYHYEAINVEAQERNPRSLLWWMRRLIALRNKHKAFSRGSLEFLYPENSKILVFLRKNEEETILVVANLSRFVQDVEIDLSRFNGYVPVEMFGQKKFRTINEEPYYMILGPYSFYWFNLIPKKVEAPPLAKSREAPLPTIKVSGEWTSIFSSKQIKELEIKLPAYLRTRRWFGGKAKTIDRVVILDKIKINQQGQTTFILLIQVSFRESLQETYCLPLGFAQGEQMDRLLNEHPGAVFIGLQTDSDKKGLLYDAMWNETFLKVLLDTIYHKRRFKGEKGDLTGLSTKTFPSHMKKISKEDLTPSVSKAEQSNTSAFFGTQLVLKLIRRLETGVNPDYEIGSFLTDKAKFSHSPASLGSLQYQVSNREPMTLGVIQTFVENEGDAWKHTLDFLGRYFEKAAAKNPDQKPTLVFDQSLNAIEEKSPPDLVKELVGVSLEETRLIGLRTGELHMALSKDSPSGNFAPESFTGFYQQSQYQSIRGQTKKILQLLKSRIKSIPEKYQKEAQYILDQEKTIMDRFLLLKNSTFKSKRIRIHGDYHLGQIMFTGKDFIIIDFEGEPARSMSERKLKMSPLKDIAGMIRSFHYASCTGAKRQTEKADGITFDDLTPWRSLWYNWTKTIFLKSYMETIQDAPFTPPKIEEFQVLLDIYLLEKALYELGYELNNRPDWVWIPIQGILDVLNPAPQQEKAAGKKDGEK